VSNLPAHMWARQAGLAVRIVPSRRIRRICNTIKWLC
jgi:hypothetical protein